MLTLNSLPSAIGETGQPVIDRHIPGKKMAIGAVFFSLPVAILSAFWVSVFHGYGATEAVAVYSTSGFLTLLTVVTAIALSTRQEE
jgi:hypothetical protein